MGEDDDGEVREPSESRFEASTARRAGKEGPASEACETSIRILGVLTEDGVPVPEAAVVVVPEGPARSELLCESAAKLYEQRPKPTRDRHYRHRL